MQQQVLTFHGRKAFGELGKAFDIVWRVPHFGGSMKTRHLLVIDVLQVISAHISVKLPAFKTTCKRNVAGDTRNMLNNIKYTATG